MDELAVSGVLAISHIGPASWAARVLVDDWGWPHHASAANGSLGDERFLMCRTGCFHERPRTLLTDRKGDRGMATTMGRGCGDPRGGRICQ